MISVESLSYCYIFKKLNSFKLEEEERDGSNRLVPVALDPLPFEDQVRHDFADLLVQDEFFFLKQTGFQHR